MDSPFVTPLRIARALSGEEDDVLATDAVLVGEPERAEGRVPGDDARRPVALPDLDTEADVRAALAIARDRRQQLVRDAHAPSTQRAYDADWRAFSTWCAQVARVEPQHRALPTSDDTLSTYIAHRLDLAPGSIRRAVSAIRLRHERQGYPMLDQELPITCAALRGHVRQQARAGRTPVQATAATDDCIRTLVDALDITTLKGLRDRALLLVGYDTGLRRSELVAIDVEDLERVRAAPAGFTVRIPVSKSDQDGAKRPVVAMRTRPDSPYCPVAALAAWLTAADITRGAVFTGLRANARTAGRGPSRLSDRAVARIIQAAATAAGLEGHFSGHSLRRGMITSALDGGADLLSVQRHARHARLDTTLGYREQKSAQEAHPGVGLFAALTDEAHKNESNY